MTLPMQLHGGGGCSNGFSLASLDYWAVLIRVECHWATLSGLEGSPGSRTEKWPGDYKKGKSAETQEPAVRYICSRTCSGGLHSIENVLKKTQRDTMYASINAVVLGLAALASGHGLVTKPVCRSPGAATQAVCGKTMGRQPMATPLHPILCYNGR